MITGGKNKSLGSHYFSEFLILYKNTAIMFVMDMTCVIYVKVLEIKAHVLCVIFNPGTYTILIIVNSIKVST